MVLQRLHKKGEVQTHRDGKKYIYSPALATEKAGLNALKTLIETFFTGSATQAVSALLGDRQKISDDELEQLEMLIRKAKEERQ